MRKMVRVFVIALALLACASLSLSAAGGKVSTEKEVHLYGYLLGSAPPGMPDVMTALNEKLKKDINATMEINYLGWSDYATKYPLVLAAGENVDWVYAANWCQYGQQAVKGAFLTLTDDMLKTYMPKHYAAVPPQGWQQAKIGGNIMMVPTSTPDRKVPILLIRGDLRKKYKIPAVKKYSELGPYLDAIKKNEPGMIPINIEAGYDLGFLFDYYRREIAPPIIWAIPNAVNYIFNYELKVPKATTELDGQYGVAFVKAAKFIKSWADKGYINKDVFANKVRSRESFEQGKSAIAFGNSQDSQGTIAKATEEGFAPELIPSLSSTGTYPADPYINNGIAISAASKNAERALMAMDLIMEDPVYGYLVYFGIEGTNYVVKNGKIDLPEGLTADKNTYPPDAAGFWFTNKDLHKPMASWPPAYVTLRAGLKKMLFVTPYAALQIDPESVKNELATAGQVWEQYAKPIFAGSVPDVDKAIATLKDKLKVANNEKVLAEIQRQMDAYAATLK